MEPRRPDPLHRLQDEARRRREDGPPRPEGCSLIPREPDDELTIEERKREKAARTARRVKGEVSEAPLDAFTSKEP
jgi:hypothetical protein